MRVGSELKAARKKAGISVEVIAERTKIKVSRLVALEKGDFKNLPKGLYLFSAVRAYAREVHIDPEPIVERLRAEFADQDALDALQALDANGALGAKNLANQKGSTQERSNLLRNVAIAAGVVLMAAAGAGAYLHNTGRMPREVRSNKVEQPPAAPIINALYETPSVPTSAPGPATTVATAVDVPQQAAAPAQKQARTKTRRSKPRTDAVTRQLQEPEANVGALSDALGSAEAPVPATAP